MTTLEPWFFLLSPAADAATNMAVDEALLRTAATRGVPLLRVYSWDRPSVSFGYFQKYPAQLADAHAVVRRLTGGGVVYHGDDTTYTVIVPPGHALDTMKTSEAYCALHRAVAAALAGPSGLHDAAATSPRGQYECFQNPVAGDVIADGQKLAGGAQRRTKWGMLHQGSIAAKLRALQLAEGFRTTMAIHFRPYELTGEERAGTEWLATGKYGTEAWNKRVE